MDELTQALQENWALIAPVLILQAILMVVALIDCFKHDKTNGPQWIWVLVIVFINIIGPILYFVFGRRND
ncbi:PLD nuclease N-terminal domain-containing protein [Salipaludibacillus sp. CUR1]|uniref:PLD nuclease N-terminal domain-containing protein n=1 Tax=Salipaludibacillus sp. CUR1 TaxID=2820003 RepID=UPI001E4ACF13|nr:PLD nuclease N-terminal domain-containing protein [Salipaludibacillus sp. CUR1]MCE7792276.1 PLD nuclease N-terminal domain-containing protein [Salipaludibacillus sp. CUR1]